MGLRNEIKIVLSSIVIAVLLGFTQVPNSIQYAYACEEGDVQHWSSIQINVDVELQHNTEPSLFNGNPVLLPIPTMGSELVSNNSIKTKIADRLNELGYTDTLGNPVEETDIEDAQFQNGDYGYSTICKNGIMQVVGGLLLQPDSATLLLAYGIANSIWIVPSVAGIGIAVYLVKRKK